MIKRYAALFFLLVGIVVSGCDSKNSNGPSAKPEAIWENSPYEPTSVAMELIQVSPRAYYVTGPPGTPTDNDGFMSNAGVVITDEGVVVLDALGTPSLAYLLLSKIRELTDKPVVKVVLTHYHADHIYGLQVFKELGAEIIAPSGAKKYLVADSAEARLKERRESLFPWVNENTYLVKPDRYISDKTQFTLGGIDFLLTPLGSTHSDGDLTMEVVQENVLYSGDLIFEGRVPFVAGSNIKNWIDNLSGLNTKKYKIIIPGHGKASAEPKDAINFTLGYLNILHKNMLAGVEAMTPFDEAYDAMDLGVYAIMPAARVNRLNAYSIYIGLEASSVDE
jgi:glyoxylase-like metal-dependent hydrolase (beta-lactamase superfamily II)